MAICSDVVYIPELDGLKNAGKPVILESGITMKDACEAFVSLCGVGIESGIKYGEYNNRVKNILRRSGQEKREIIEIVRKI